MPLTEEQRDQLLSNYVTKIVGGMDYETLVNCVMEQIIINLTGSCETDESLIEEISRFNDESDVAAMLEDVGANPTDFGIRNRLDDVTL